MQLAERTFLALKRHQPLPWEMQDANLMMELEVHPTLTELDDMPVSLIERCLILKAVIGFVANGCQGELQV